LTLNAEMPIPYGFEGSPKTIGEHLRKHRMDLGMYQKDLARMLGTDMASLRNWEMGRSVPVTRFMPAIIKFLGRDPRPRPQKFSALLRHLREALGLSQEALARMIGADESALSDWEAERHWPTPASIKKAVQMFPELSRLVN
jgi:DNA-binding transcriptional regulator YiaG